MLPLPGSLKHYAKVDDLVAAVRSGEMDAGFIDERDFKRIAADAEAPVELRLIAKTKPVPDMLVLQSPKAKPEIIRQVTDFLLEVGEKNPEALRPLLASGYAKPSVDLCAWVEPIEKTQPENPPTDE